MVSNKPRLRLAASGRWECADLHVARAGKTPREAYDHWMVAAVLDAQERSMVKARAARAKRTRPAPPPVAAPPGPRAPGLKKARAEALPFQGTVQVLPGTRAAPKPLILPPQMRLAAQRAAECQVRLSTLSGPDNTPRQALAGPPDDE